MVAMLIPISAWIDRNIFVIAPSRVFWGIGRQSSVRFALCRRGAERIMNRAAIWGPSVGVMPGCFAIAARFARPNHWMGELAMNVLSILRSKGSDVITTAPNATVMDAARIMTEKGIGAVLVLDRGRVVGVISERDIVRTVATKGVAALYLEVDQLMSSEVFTRTRSATSDELMTLMTERRIRHVPIVEDHQLYGLVSIGDVVKHRIAETEKEAEALRDYIHAG